jgi:pyruvate dehydrogenase phosphatase
MRRAAVRAFRTARLAPSTRLSLRSSRSGFQSSSYALGIRHSSGRTDPTSKASPASKIPGSTKGASSMYFRRFSVAFVSGLVGYGAWYTYKAGAIGNSATSPVSASQQTRGLSSSTPYSIPAATQGGEEVQRKAVIVGADSIYTGDIPGNQPITKDTDESGRKVLEMLTPEQATQRLRRNEESYFVGRGQGVVRYDVVQIPSNDPIEDDHSEKIIELPATAGQSPTSDWMFWGVFDGHA